MKTSTSKLFGKISILFILLFMSSMMSGVKSQPNLPMEWHTFWGSATGQLIDHGQDIAYFDGFIFASGFSCGTWDVPPGNIVRNHISSVQSWNIGRDGYVVMMTPAGDVVWLTYLGSFWDDECIGIEVTPSGIYVCGYSGGVWPDEDLLFSQGKVRRRHFVGNGNDAFVARLNFDGTINWISFLGGIPEDKALGISVDEDLGFVYATGFSNGAWLPDPYQNNLVNPYSGGQNDAFAVKLDIFGNCFWHTFMGGPNGNGQTDHGIGVDFDGFGNVYVGGWSAGTWGPPLPGFEHQGAVDIYPDEGFIAKLDFFGNRQWNLFIGNTQNPGFTDRCHDIEVDLDGNIYATGYSWGDWGPAWGTPIVSYGTNQQEDIFVTKINTNGQPQWYTILGEDGGNQGHDIELMSNGDLYISGFDGDCWGNPTLPAASGADAFAMKLDNDGNLLWRTMMGGHVTDVALGIAISPAESVYLTGYSFLDWLCVDPPLHPHTGNPVPFSISGWLHTDVFMTNLNPVGSVFVPDEIDITVVQGDVAATLVTLNDVCDKVISVSESLGSLSDNGDDTYDWTYNTTGVTPGEYTVTITGDDGNCWTPSVIINLEVTPANEPPVFEVDTDPVIVVIGTPAINTGTLIDPDGDDIWLCSDPNPCGNLVNDGDGTWTWTYPSESLGLGEHWITIWADDGNNAAVYRHFYVNVIPDEENLPPEISCPDDITIYTNVGCTSDQAIGLATATDDYDPDPVITNDAPDFFPLGETIVEWTATDDEGLFITCTQTVTVVDNVPPDISCPIDQTLASDEGLCTATVDPGTATATDNCTAVPVILGERSDGLALSAPYPFGITTITWTATDAADNSTSCDQIINVNKITTWLEVQVINPVSGIQQYSDLVSLQACVMPFDCNWPEDTEPGLAQGFVDFYIEYEDASGTYSQYMGQRPVTSNGCAYLFDAPLLEDPEGLFGEGPLTPGIKNVRAVFTSSGNDNYLGSEGECENCLEIIQECAQAEYVGVQMQATPSAEDDMAEVKLMATVWECDDEWPGDIRNACVTFVLKDPAGIELYSVPAEDLELVFPDDKTIGIASAHITVSTNVYTVEVHVGCYYLGTAYSTLVVYEPDGDHITGGGYIIPPDTYFAKTYPIFGQIASDDVKWNYGFNVTYGKKGKRLKGHVNIILRNNEGGVFQIKSNAMASLGVDVSDPTAKKAVYMAKADLHDVTGEVPVWIEGNLILLVTITDRGEPGVEDEIGITLWSAKDGKVKLVPDELLLSSEWDWDNNITLEQYIAGGNLVVHSGYSIKIGEIDETEILISESSLSVYPNPFSNIIWFEFSSATDSRAILEIYDLTGRKLASLMDKNVKAGQEYRLNYQPGGDVANGLLFYKLIMDGDVTTGKVVHRR